MYYESHVHISCRWRSDLVILSTIGPTLDCLKKSVLTKALHTFSAHDSRVLSASGAAPNHHTTFGLSGSYGTRR